MSRRKTSVNYQEEESLGLKPETKRAIFVILLFTLAALSVLSIFDMAGSFGRVLNFALAYIFGWGIWLFILILLWLVYILMKSGIYGVRFVTYIGLSLILLSFSGILHFFVLDFNLEEITAAGKGGGAIGYFISEAGVSALGVGGSLVILLAILFIGVFLGFNTSFSALLDKAKTLGIIKEKFLPDKGTDGEDENTEEENEFQTEDIIEEDQIEEPVEEGGQEPAGEIALAEGSVEEEEQVIPVKKVRKKIVVPIELLSKSTSKPDSGDVNANMNKIQKTFEFYSC